MPSSIRPLLTVAEIRQIETDALAKLPPGTLMQRAGRAAANFALHLLPEQRNEASVLVLAGPGNNGGDALETAHLLAASGARVTVICWADNRQREDAQQALARARNSAVQFIATDAIAALAARSWDLVIDGLFGIGLARPISGTMSAWVDATHTLACPVLALDVPSGLDADTGDVIGSENSVAIRASHTLTFIADKPGLHTCFGRDHAGQVQLAHLDIEDKRLGASNVHLNCVAAFSGFLRRRTHNSHKGNYGDVTVIGGASGMAGATVLAARTAAKCGAGRVFAAFLDSPPAYDGAQPELMCRRADDLSLSSGTIVIGPGLGTTRHANDILAKAMHAPVPLVLDADALNLVAEEPGLQRMLALRKEPALMTPHPLEAARLLATTAREVQANRLAAARELALHFNCVTVLKGSGSVIAKPGGEVMINPTGGPALATAGTGDVLAGVCGALLAQSFPAWNAALAATWLHGRAADVLTAEHGGAIGITASELIPCLPTLLNRLTEEHAAGGRGRLHQ
jgi:hydroxyethylthiazole kinase-like uncharacterized protein yjeF